MKDIHNESISIINKWIRKIEDDSLKENENIRENLSHLRSSALKVQEARPQSYVPYFLHAYSILSDPDMDIRSGINSFVTGMKNLKGLRTNYRSNIHRICTHIFEGEDNRYLEEVSLILGKEYGRSNELVEMREALKEELKIRNLQPGKASDKE